MWDISGGIRVATKSVSCSEPCLGVGTSLLSMGARENSMTRVGKAGMPSGNRKQSRDRG